MSNRTIFDCPHALAILANVLNEVGEPVFFGRRYLRYRDLCAIGVVNNRMTLARQVAAGKLPKPLYLTPGIPLWDTLELARALHAAKRSSGEKEVNTRCLRPLNAREAAPSTAPPPQQIISTS